jgi:HSP20 family protein
MERQYGTFYREIPLPEGVQTDKIQASLNDGVLEVDIPMPTQQQTQGQKIQVK